MALGKMELGKLSRNRLKIEKNKDMFPLKRTK